MTFCYFNLCYTFHSTHLWLIPVHLHMILHHFIRSHNVHSWFSSNTGLKGTDLSCSWKSVCNLQSTLHICGSPISTDSTNRRSHSSIIFVTGKHLHISRPMQFKLVLFKGQLSFTVPLSTCGPKPCILLLHIFSFHSEKKKMLVAQSCPTLWDLMNCSWPGSCVHGILQARIPEWVAIPFSRGSSQPRDRTQVSHIAGRFLTVWATREISYYNLHTIAILHTTTSILHCYFV